MHTAQLVDELVKHLMLNPVL